MASILFSLLQKHKVSLIVGNEKKINVALVHPESDDTREKEESKPESGNCLKLAKKT